METERLLIRRFTPDDWRDLFAYLSQEAVVQYEPYGVFTEEESKREALRRSEDSNFWAVCLKDGGQLIGSIYLRDRYNGVWELGYVFNQNFQGRGYAAEAAGALIGDTFKHQNAHRIEAMCNPANTASWRLLERLRFRREGHLRSDTCFKKDEAGNPIWTDTFIYGLLAPEWP